jgi:hypothetical protein
VTTRRAAELAIGYDPTFRRQSAWDVPNPEANILASFPAQPASRNFIDVEETNESVFECTGRHLMFEILTGRLARLSVDFDFDPQVAGGIVAFAYGVAALGAAGVNATFTVTIDATGGTFFITYTNAFGAFDTAPIAWNATAAAVTAALVALPNIGAGNVVAAGADGGPYTLTFQGALAREPIATPVPNADALVGGAQTAVIAPGAAGTGARQNISQLPGFAPPLLTLYVGYRDSDKRPTVFKNVVVNSFRCRGSARQAMVATVEFIGSADLQPASDLFVLPPCQDIIPVRFPDCQLLLNGVDQSALMRNLEYYYQNNILTGDHPFTGAGVDATRFETADQRPSGINFGLLGEPGDPAYNQAQAKSIMPMAARIGPVGRNVTFNVPAGALRFGSPRINHDGEARESILNLQGQPRWLSAVAGVPSNVVAYTDQASAYLVSA